jgi:cytochrome c biogenesis protein CcmG/thiol:disulfide interchange protein DsbE
VRRVLIVLGVLALTALVVVGLTQATGGGEDTPAPREKFDLQGSLDALQGAPPPLASLHQQANTLVEATPVSFEERLAALEGTPVVVNKWASWCGPCRAEFPIFQRLATDLGKEVAFLGLNSRDGRKPATSFLDDFPVPYPSFEDPEERIAQDLGAPANYPITLFYDSKGERAFIKQGGYRTADDLRADIERYAR